MTEPKIAKEILIKLIDVKAIHMRQTATTESIDKVLASNEKNLRIVCDAYTKIFKAITSAKSEDYSTP